MKAALPSKTEGKQKKVSRTTRPTRIIKAGAPRTPAHSHKALFVKHEGNFEVDLVAL